MQPIWNKYGNLDEIDENIVKETGRQHRDKESRLDEIESRLDRIEGDQQWKILADNWHYRACLGAAVGIMGANQDRRKGQRRTGQPSRREHLFNGTMMGYDFYGNRRILDRRAASPLKHRDVV